MKKTIFVFALAALFVSCAKESEQAPSASGEVITVAPAEFHATLETPEPDTRTALGGDNGKTVLWESGDKISVWAGFNEPMFEYALKSVDDATLAYTGNVVENEWATPVEMSCNAALYPYSESAWLSFEDSECYFGMVPFADVQHYKENSIESGILPMVAVTSGSDDYNLEFKNLAGILRLVVKGSAVIDHIIVKSAESAPTRFYEDEPVCGMANVAMSNGADPVVSFDRGYGYSSLILDCGDTGVKLSADGTVFNIVLPPLSKGFTVTIWDTNGGNMKLSSDSEIKRNVILSMPAVEYAPSGSAPAYVDLGLPSGTKWATCNVGAATAEEFGYYFNWGEVVSSIYSSDWGYYKYKGWTKYNKTDGLTVLEAIDDPATRNIGAAWRTPTYDEWKELVDYCDRTDATISGVPGVRISSKSNPEAYIFLPKGGYRNGTSSGYINESCYYWTSSLYSDDGEIYSQYAYAYTSYGINNYPRNCNAMPIRPVLVSE